MARDFNGSSDNIIAGSTPVTAVPLTLAAWFKSDSSTAAQVILSVGVNGGSHRFQLVANGSVVGDPVQAATISGTTGTAATTAGYTVGQWHHGCAVFSSTTSRTAYIDAANSGTDTTSSTPTGLNRIVIGARYATSLGAYFDGSIAEIGIWNVALTVDEITSLARGYPPSDIRPQSLVFCPPLIRDVQDLRGGLALTVSGTSVAAHPRRIG